MSFFYVKFQYLETNFSIVTVIHWTAFRLSSFSCFPFGSVKGSSHLDDNGLLLPRKMVEF